MRIITTNDLGNLVRSSQKKAKLTKAELAAASGVGERSLIGHFC